MASELRNFQSRLRAFVYRAFRRVKSLHKLGQSNTIREREREPGLNCLIELVRVRISKAAQTADCGMTNPTIEARMPRLDFLIKNLNVAFALD